MEEGGPGKPLGAFAQKVARAISDANVFHVRGPPDFRDPSRRPPDPSLRRTNPATLAGGDGAEPSLQSERGSTDEHPHLVIVFVIIHL